VRWSEEKKTFNFGEFDELSGGVFKSQKLRCTCVEKAQACQALWRHETDPRQVQPHFSFSSPNMTKPVTGLQKQLTFSAHGTKLALPAPFCTLFAKVWSFAYVGNGDALWPSPAGSMVN
jgi:hypothetical protein